MMGRSCLNEFQMRCFGMRTATTVRHSCGRSIQESFIKPAKHLDKMGAISSVTNQSSSHRIRRISLFLCWKAGSALRQERYGRDQRRKSEKPEDSPKLP